MTATKILDRLILHWRSSFPARLLPLLERLLASQRRQFIAAIQQVMDEDDAAEAAAKAERKAREIPALPTPSRQDALDNLWTLIGLLENASVDFLQAYNVTSKRAEALSRFLQREAEVLDEAKQDDVLHELNERIRREMENRPGGAIRRADDLRKAMIEQEHKAAAERERKDQLAKMPESGPEKKPTKRLVIMVGLPPNGRPGLEVKAFDWLEQSIFKDKYLPAVSNLEYDKVRRLQYGNETEVAKSVQALQAEGFEVRATDKEAAGRLSEGANLNSGLVGAADEHLERMIALLGTRGLVPRPYQLTGIRWLRATKAGALLDEMGLGKTMQVLLAMGRRGLVLCPASVKGVWARECKLWRPDLKPTILVGLNTFRWPEDGELLIVNYDLLRVEKPAVAEVAGTIKIIKGKEQTVEEAEREAGKTKVRKTHVRLLPRYGGGGKSHYDFKLPASRVTVKDGQTVQVGDSLYDAHDDITPAGPAPWDLAVALDEGHVVKNETTLRARAAQLIGRRVAEVGGYRWLVTATPVCNRPLELKAVLEAIGAFGTAFTSRAAFARAFGNRINDAEAEPTEEASRALARVAMRRTRNDVGKQIPPLQFMEIPVALEGEALAAAEEIERILRPQVEAAEAEVVRKGGTPQEIAKAIERAMLAQESIGAMSRARRTIAVAKLPTALELIDSMEDSGQSIVVASAHRDVCEGAVRHDRDNWGLIVGGVNNNDRTEIVEAFQAGKLRGLAMTIKTGGVGLTLTRSSVMIGVDLEWNPSLNEQCFARIDPVRGRPEGAMGGTSTVYLLKSNAWIEQKLTELLLLKARMIAATVEPVSKLGGQLPEGPEMEDIAVGPPDRNARAEYEIAGAPGLIKPQARRGWITEEAILDKVRRLGTDSNTSNLGKWILDRLREEERKGAPSVPPRINGQGLESVLEEIELDIARKRREQRKYEEDARPARTNQERFAADAMLTLKDLDPDKAREINDQGFGGSTQDGHRLANLIRAGIGLTDEDWQRAIVIARHHHRQVGKMPEASEGMRWRRAG